MSDGVALGDFVPVLWSVHHKIIQKIDGWCGVKCPVRTVWPGRSGEGAGASDGNGSDKHYRPREQYLVGVILQMGQFQGWKTGFAWPHPWKGLPGRMIQDFIQNLRINGRSRVTDAHSGLVLVNFGWRLFTRTASKLWYLGFCVPSSEQLASELH